MTGLSRNTAWGLGGLVGSGVASLGTVVLLSHGLPAAVHGQVQLWLAALVVIGFGSQVGVTAATIHRLAAGRRPPSDVLGAALVSTTVTGGAVAAGLVVARHGVSSALGGDLPPDGVVALAVAAVPRLWSLVVGGFARGRDRFAEAAVAEVLPPAAGFVAVAVALAQPGADAVTVATALAWAHGLAGGALVLGAWASAGGLSMRSADLREMTRYGARVYPTTVAGQVHERLDVVVLAALTDPASIAVYAVAVGVVNRLRWVPLALSAALYPRIAQADGASAGALTLRAVMVGAAVAAAAGLGLAAVAPVVMPWAFGEVGRDAVALLAWLIPATVAFSSALLLTRWFQARDRPAAPLAAQLTGIAVNLALNLWWVPRFGAAGAAAASLASYTWQATWLAVGFAAATGDRRPTTSGAHP